MNHKREEKHERWKDKNKENYNSKREDLKDKDQQQDERNVIL